MLKIFEEAFITGDSTDEFSIEVSKQMINSVMENAIEESKLLQGGYATVFLISGLFSRK